MAESPPPELEAAAVAYQARLVPALMEPWTEAVLDAAGVAAGQRVLDVACGSGVLARAAAARVGASGAVAGLDLNPAMLAVAGRQDGAIDGLQIDWQQGDVAALPFPDAGFDAVVSQFGLMLFPDPAVALGEMARVLKPAGRLAVAVFDGLEANPGYAALVEVYRRVAGEAVAGALAAPFAMGDQDALLATFAGAGLQGATLITLERQACFRDWTDLVLADVDGWFPVAGLSLDRDAIETVKTDAAAALARYEQADGRVAFPARAHLVSVTKT